MNKTSIIIALIMSFTAICTALIIYGNPEIVAGIIFCICTTIIIITFFKILF